MPPAQLWVGGISVGIVSGEKGSGIDGKLQIRNLARTTTEDELWRLFAQVGDVLEVRIPRDRLSGDSRGYGFVTMSAVSEADAAVSRLNDRVLNGLKLQVVLVKPRITRGNSLN